MMNDTINYINDILGDIAKEKIKSMFETLKIINYNYISYKQL